MDRIGHTAASSAIDHFGQKEKNAGREAWTRHFTMQFEQHQQGCTRLTGASSPRL
jgi:hypothetical protein